jgi:hypothetical protein
MSFICEFCGKATKDGEESNSIVTETRKKTYNNGGTGQEIVKEKISCLKCHPKV